MKTSAPGIQNLDFSQRRFSFQRILRAAWPYSVRYAILLLPMAMVTLFVIWPMILTVLHSFQVMNARGQASGFAGVKNYAHLFHSSLFRQVMTNTVIYAGISVVLCIVIAFGLSFLLNSRSNSASRLLLVGLFSPTITPMIAAANIWLFFLTPGFGIVDKVMRFVGFGKENWLGHPTTATIVLILLFVWKYAPYFTLFLLAGLQAIPPDVRESLRTEDPHKFYGFRKVILPILSPMIGFVTTMAVLYAVETIDPVYVLTQGGPNNATNLVMYYLFKLGFNYYSWGEAAALSAILLGGLATLSGLSLIVMERRAFHWQ
ncbi:carbohydrate ABC transporter permease [Alicyclobacillus sp. SO9]|uniref:carbohydrate ABC transporter permease n=1 Tax=Alicyclobacillus sp. SO9 TaxID=2665646 RepID=UPI0018E7F437|nr:sugar ABC transporter permease [Alicyclobacillus sp. SO9]QQE78990.1 sugar ABC transporter permease [Alicyclobacillus sp. SO9]